MPCLTTAQITEVLEYIDGAKTFLNQQGFCPGSRFCELEAYAFDIALLPVGTVPADEEGRKLASLNDINLSKAEEIIKSATPDIVPPEDEPPVDLPPPIESTGDACTDITNAINRLSSLDFGITINQLQTELYDLKVSVTSLINPDNLVTINSNILGVVAIIDNEILPSLAFLVNSSGILDADIAYIKTQIDTTLLRLEDTRIELKEARECCHRLEVELSERTVEILERIHDTRVELKEARDDAKEVLTILKTDISGTLQGENCTDLDPSYNYTGLGLVGLQSQMSALSLQVKDLTTVVCGVSSVDVTAQIAELRATLIAQASALAMLIADIETGSGGGGYADLLTAIQTKLDVILNEINNLVVGSDVEVNLDPILAAIAALKLDGDDNANTIINNISSVQTTINTLDLSTVNNTLNQLIQYAGDTQSTVNNTYTELTGTTTAPPTKLDRILIGLELLDVILGLLEQLQNLLTDKTLTNTSYSCDEEGILQPKTYTASGDGFDFVASALSILSIQLNDLQLIVGCNNGADSVSIEGSFTTYDCDTKEIVLPYSGNGILGVESAITALSKQIDNLRVITCESAKDCTLILPGDEFAEVFVPRQLSVTILPVDMEGKKYDDYRKFIHVPNPVDDINWCTHIEPFKFWRGKSTGRVSWENSKLWSGSTYRDEDECVRISNHIASISTRTAVDPDGRFTKRGSPKYNQKPPIEYHAVKAVITSLNPDGTVKEKICLTRPPNGC